MLVTVNKISFKLAAELRNGTTPKSLPSPSPRKINLQNARNSA